MPETNLRVILEDSKPEIILFSGDIWDFFPLKMSIMEYKEKNPSTILVSWVTVDGECLHSSWGEAFQFMDAVATFSNFGQRIIEKLSSVKAAIPLNALISGTAAFNSFL